jgi:4Fe-4S ferredoxin
MKMISIQRNGKENREINHNNDNCLGCGICTEVCPTSSLTLGPILTIARRTSKKDYIEMNENKCVLCGLCSFACPFNAIEFKINDINAKNLDDYPKWSHKTNINEDKCILCKNCKSTCPRDAIYIKRNLPKLKDLVVGEIRTEVDKCITCRICEEMCPSRAIKINTKNNFGKGRFITENIEIDSEKCVYCKICQKICPENAIRIICTTCMDNEQILNVNITGNIVLNDEISINCGWCKIICPSDAIQSAKPFQGRVILKENQEDEKICTGKDCNECKDVCPCNAITISDNTISVNQDVCVLCGACAKVCPEEILFIKRSFMELTNIKSAAWEKILSNLIN